MTLSLHANRRSSAAQLLRKTLPPIITLVLVVIAWDLVVRIWRLPPFLLPSPENVVAAAWKKRQALSSATAITALAAFCGFLSSLLIGTLIAFGFSQSRAIRASGYPYAIFLQTVPVVAIAPLIVNWFGNGLQSVIIVAFIVSLFPVITNATTGMLSVDPDLLDLFRLHRASRWQQWIKLRLPNAVPHILTGARTASGLSVIGSIVGEFVVGYGNQWVGLGYLITTAQSQLKTADLLASVFASTLLGLSIFAAMNVLSQTVLARWYDLSER